MHPREANALRALARATGLTEAQIIRAAINLLLDEYLEYGTPEPGPIENLKLYAEMVEEEGGYTGARDHEARVLADQIMEFWHPVGVQGREPEYVFQATVLATAPENDSTGSQHGEEDTTER